MYPDTPTTRPPMTRKEARAAGLKVFAWGMTCKACRTREKFIHSATCATCPARALEARKARDLVVGAQVRRRVLKTAVSQALRQIKADATRAVREAERAGKAAQREALKTQRLADKKAATVAKARATRQANKEEAARLAILGAECAGPAAALLPAWEALEEAHGMVSAGVGLTAALLPPGGPQALRDDPEDLEDWNGAPPWE